MRFRDRRHAAALLADGLVKWRGRHPLVLAIPRGAVPMGSVIADALEGELDLVLIRKLGAPGSPEFAVGAVAESGWTYLAAHAAGVGADADYLEHERAAQMRRLYEQRIKYTPDRAPIPVAGRIVIVVDDGLATGATMIAALHAVRAQAPARLICAIPVAAADSLEAVRSLADEIVCLSAPQDFVAVGAHYEDFGQVEDEEVIDLLAAPPAPG